MARKTMTVYEVFFVSTDGVFIGAETKVPEDWDSIAVICRAAAISLETRGYDCTGFCFHSLRVIR